MDWPSITNTPAGNISAVTVQAAINELDTEKEPTISSGAVSQYWRGDKTWQLLDASAVGLGNVENIALSTWSGSTNITTVDTITTGVWHGNTITPSYGGTGITSFQSGTFIRFLQ